MGSVLAGSRPANATVPLLLFRVSRPHVGILG